jgi:hypothetical protein
VKIGICQQKLEKLKSEKQKRESWNLQTELEKRKRENWNLPTET